MPRRRSETGGKAVPRNAANARERTRQGDRESIEFLTLSTKPIVQVATY
jgi:hypothetical protein